MKTVSYKNKWDNLSYGIDRILAIGILLLFLSTEGTLQPSIQFVKYKAWWTLWLYKPFFLSIADIIMITIAIFTLFRILLKPRIINSPYIPICLLAAIYLFIGLIYNLSVYTLWKPYLYGCKVVFYLLVPYLFLCTIKNKKSIVNLFHPKYLLIFMVISRLIDFVVVNLFGKVELPHILGLPPILSLVPMNIIIVALLYVKKIKYKFFWILVFLFEVVNAINKIEGATLLSIITIPFIIFIVLKPNYSRVMRFIVLLIAVLIINLFILVNIYGLYENPLSELKKGGLVTRRIQIDNAIENFKHNIPGLIGKGLGTTWFEDIPIPRGDIYAVGHSLGPDIKKNMQMPVKYIFHTSTAVLIHRWGILGTLILILLISRYYNILLGKIKNLKSLGLSSDRYVYLKAILIISFLYIFDSFTYPGLLKKSLITSVLAFYIKNQIDIQKNKLVVKQ